MIVAMLRMIQDILISRKKRQVFLKKRKKGKSNNNDYEKKKKEARIIQSIQERDVKTILKLSRQQLKASERDMLGDTPMCLAVRQNMGSIVGFLAKYQDVNEGGRAMDVPLHIAIIAENNEMVNQLIQLGANVNQMAPSGRTPLNLAIQRGNVDAFHVLLKHGACINLKDKYNQKPLMIAMQRNNAEMVDTLMRYLSPRDLHRIGQGGESALHIAIRCRQLKRMRQLLKTGMIINTRNVSGVTPVLLAAEMGLSSFVDVLINHRANVIKMDSKGNTVLSWCVYHAMVPQIHRLLAMHPHQLHLSRSSDHQSLLHLVCRNDVSLNLE